MRPPFAYVFERFPSFTQTFCAREVMGLQRAGVEPMIFSIHDTRGEETRHFPEELVKRVKFLPQGEALVEEVKDLKSQDLFPQKVVLTLRHWGDKPDKRRVHEAAWIGYHLAAAGVRHVHAHFAGLAARTCWWIREFYGCSYSFTGHANDILCPDPWEVSRERLVADAALVVTVSDFTATFLREKYRAGRKVRRVYNGLDIETIASGIGSAPKDDPPLVFSVGRLTPKKGFGDLIDACALLRDQGVGFRCEIAGGGELQDDLARRIAARGLEGRVTLAGPMDMPAILERLHRARVFALACATEDDGGMDNLPTVLMEAMAAGLPCVSTRLAGVPEMVVDGRTGLLAPEKSPGQLAAALRRLIENPALAASFGAAGLSRARKNFAREITTRALLRALVARGKIRPRLAWIARDPMLALVKLLP